MFWTEENADKLPTDVTVENLMLHWDELKNSWNNQDFLGCILPNNKNDTVVVNAKFLLRAEKHWTQVHVPKQQVSSPFESIEFIKILTFKPLMLFFLTSLFIIMWI